jgi:hypothetical protein
LAAEALKLLGVGLGVVPQMEPLQQRADRPAPGLGLAQQVRRPIGEPVQLLQQG